MISIPIICYSHSTYSDVSDIFFKQLDKYLPGVKKYLFVDSSPKNIPSDVEVILYDDSTSYPDRVSSCLKNVKEELCIFHHEDMILYDEPNISKLNELIKFILEYDISYIKLLKGGDVNDLKLDDMPIDNLFYIPHHGLSFAIQPTIWKVDKLLEIYSNSKKPTEVGNKAIGDFEIYGSEYINNSDIEGLYWYSGEQKRGGAHWDSSVYPHGNFISKGRWVYSEYKNELEHLHKKYNIEKNIRGMR
jgi:hypothetical protein